MEEPLAFANTCPNAFAGIPGYIFVSLISTIISRHCELGPEGKYPQDYSGELRDEESFDFIVVGGGSAGSIVASRLAEIEGLKVLLVEAGWYPSAASEVPTFLFYIRETEEDWKYVTEVENGCKGLTGGVCKYPRGKVLGGSSTINAMMYVRGNKNDFDEWKQENWDYDTILKYFRRVENLKSQQGSTTETYGTEGVLPISIHSSKHPIRRAIIEGSEELGITKNEGFNLGYYDVPSTIHEGTRQNTAKAYLNPDTNLKLALKTKALKLIINKSEKKIEGIILELPNGTNIRVRVTKEVVLSAGAVASPVVLMNSGVGRREILEPLNVDVIEELPVGLNLQDHIMFLGLYTKVLPGSVLRKGREDVLDEFYQYVVNRRGQFSHTEMTNFAGFINTRNDSEYPNVQLFHIAFPRNDPAILPQVIEKFGIQDPQKKIMEETNQQYDTMAIFVILLKPKSKGQITIKSTNLKVPPTIKPYYLTNKEDLETILQGIRYIQKLYQTKPMKLYEPQLINLNFHECLTHNYDSDDYWKCAINQFSSTVYHTSGTCAMGTVVDERLKVKGLEGLRVIDASVMPSIVSGNTNAATMMIGERGVDLLKEDWFGGYKRDEL